MQKVKIESIDDLESLPENEWVEVPDGLHAEFIYHVDKKNNKLIIALPEDISKKIGSKLYALFKDGNIIIKEIKA